jgi:hypothetical protein
LDFNRILGVAGTSLKPFARFRAPLQQEGKMGVQHDAGDKGRRRAPKGAS